MHSLSSLVTGKLGMDGNKGQGDLGYQQGLFEPEDLSRLAAAK